MFNPKYFNVVTQTIGTTAEEIPCGLVDEFGAPVAPNVFTATAVHASQTVQVTVAPALATTGANDDTYVLMAKGSAASTPVHFFFARVANPNS